MTVKQLLVGILVVGTLGAGAKVLTGGEDPVEVATVDSEVTTTTAAPALPEPAAVSPSTTAPAPQAKATITTTRPRAAAVVTTTTTAPVRQVATTTTTQPVTVTTTPPTTQPVPTTTTTTAPAPVGSCSITAAQSDLVVEFGGTDQTFTLSSTSPNAPANIHYVLGGRTYTKDGTTDGSGTWVATFTVTKTQSQPVRVIGVIHGPTARQSYTCETTFSTRSAG